MYDVPFSFLEEIMKGDLHEFLGGLQKQCGLVSRALQRRYSLH
jgi:hypothetical protein